MLLEGIMHFLTQKVWFVQYRCISWLQEPCFMQYDYFCQIQVQSKKPSSKQQEVPLCKSVSKSVSTKWVQSGYNCVHSLQSMTYVMFFKWWLKSIMYPQTTLKRWPFSGKTSNGIAVTTAGQLSPVKHIIHVSIEDDGGGSDAWQRVVKRALTEADKRGLKSIAFPALGTGVLTLCLILKSHHESILVDSLWNCEQAGHNSICKMLTEIGVMHPVPVGPLCAYRKGDQD